MTPALGTAQNGVGTAGKRFGAAAATTVAVSAAPAAEAIAEGQTGRAIQPLAGAGAGNWGGESGRGGQLPLPDGLLTLLQEVGLPQARTRFASAPTPARANIQMTLAQRAYEANLHAFQAAQAQLGDTLNLFA